jgi:hypothetical protein
MQKAYKDLDIQFLPDKIIQQTNLVTQHNSVYDSISNRNIGERKFISYPMIFSIIYGL